MAFRGAGFLDLGPPPPRSVRSDGLSNPRTEAMNALLKKSNASATAFTYRLRLLLHCGGIVWQDTPAARLRRRAPQMVA